MNDEWITEFARQLKKEVYCLRQNADTSQPHYTAWLVLDSFATSLIETQTFFIRQNRNP